MKWCWSYFCASFAVESSGLQCEADPRMGSAASPVPPSTVLCCLCSPSCLCPHAVHGAGEAGAGAPGPAAQEADHGGVHPWLDGVRARPGAVRHPALRGARRLPAARELPKTQARSEGVGRGLCLWKSILQVEVVLNCLFSVKYLPKEERNVHCVHSGFNLSPLCLRKVRENGTFLLLRGQEVSCFLLLFKH